MADYCHSRGQTDSSRFQAIEAAGLLWQWGHEAQGGGRIFLALLLDFATRRPKHVGVRAYYISQWSEPILVVGWFGPKVTKCHCLAKQFFAKQSGVVWEFDSMGLKKKEKRKKEIAVMDKVYTTHTTTRLPRWRLIHSQRVPFWGCCWARVCCCRTLWTGGNYILVHPGNSASLQEALSVPSSYRAQPAEEWTSNSGHARQPSTPPHRTALQRGLPGEIKNSSDILRCKIIIWNQAI